MIKKLKDAFENTGTRPEKIFFYKTTDSTNERAKRYPDGQSADLALSLDGAPDTALFIADSQSAGRGRLGRRFISNSGAGLYMSLRFPLSVELRDAVGITPFAAVAVCRAIESLTPLRPKIKWVNDVYLGEKKLAGILTESLTLPDGRRVFVCGIGINLSPSDMPSEVKSIATDLLSNGYSVDKYELSARIADELLLGIGDIWKKEIIEEYKSRSVLTGKRIVANQCSDPFYAEVVGITDRYELTVKRENGEILNLSTGEVSIRLA